MNTQISRAVLAISFIGLSLSTKVEGRVPVIETDEGVRARAMETGACENKIPVHTYGEIAVFNPDGSFVIEQYPVEGLFDCWTWDEPEGCHTLAGIPRYDRNLDGTIQTGKKGEPFGRPFYPSCRKEFK